MTNTVCFITTNSLGQGDHQLGIKLLGNFLRLLADGDDVPAAIFLMNSGVRLSVADSPVLVHLRKLQERGTEVMSCQTCIQAYALQQDVAVGLVAGMADFLELAARYKVITIA